MYKFKKVSDDGIKGTQEINDLQWVSNGELVNLKWSIHSIRKMGNFSFVILRTNRDILQCITSQETQYLIDNLQEWDYVEVAGNVVKNGEAYKGLEIKIDNINKLSGPKGKLSMNISRNIKSNLDFVLDNRIVALRNLKLKSVFKLQEGIVNWFREYLKKNKFTEIHSPKIVKAGAEGGTNIFEIKYFNEKAYLAQSPQFYKQFMVPVFERVFEVWPVFRAEKHRTSRHINEYTSLDMEMWFIDSFRDIMSMEVWLLKNIFDVLRNEYSHELNILGVDLPEIWNGIPEVEFAKIKDIVAKEYRREYRDKNDLEPEEEILISRYIKEKTGSDFVFVTNYPASKRPFYTMQSKENPEYTESFDLLFKWLEVTTGGQRIHDYDAQVKRIEEKWLNPDNFKEYLELHKNWTPPHGGFGLWLERLTQKIIWLENVRETTLFPRDIKRLTP